MLIDLDNFEKQNESIDINSVEFIAHHCTRGFREDIESEGLKKFDLQERLSYVREKLLFFGLNDEIVSRYLLSVTQFISGQNLKYREGIVCFCLNRHLFEPKNGCDNFFKYFGGEAIYRVAQEKLEFAQVEAKLQEIGKPLVVSVKIKLDSALEYQKNKVLNVLLGKSNEGCEVFIARNVLPTEIINIEERRI